MARFKNRQQAGQILATHLRDLEARPNLIVLALPRGGVPVAFPVAEALGAPLDVFIVRKLGVPWNEEVAIGAIASGGLILVDHEALRALAIDARSINAIIERERVELDRREKLYRGDRVSPVLSGRTIILIDDGLATGATMSVAIEAIRQRSPAEIIVAVPVASREACTTIERLADRCVCVATPEPFDGVGMWYADFGQTTDAEVLALLETAERRFTTARF